MTGYEMTAYLFLLVLFLTGVALGLILAEYEKKKHVFGYFSAEKDETLSTPEAGHGDIVEYTTLYSGKSVFAVGYKGERYNQPPAVFSSRKKAEDFLQSVKEEV